MPMSKRLAALSSAALAAVLFLTACGGASSTTSHPPAPNATSSQVASATSTTVIATVTVLPSTTATPGTAFCGLDVSHPFESAPFVAPDPVGLRTQTPAGQQAFDAQIRAMLLPYTRLTAGLVEVYGSGPDSGSGEDYALSAIQALSLLADQQFVFSHQQTFFQSLWDGSLKQDYLRILVLFYLCSG